MKSRVMFILVLVLGVVLLVLAGCSTVASTPAALAQTVHVTLSDQQVSADRSTFVPGQPYHFVVTNSGQVTHQFMMTPRGWDYDHMSMRERHQRALYMYDQIAPGETKTFDYTFPTSAVGQSFGFACYQQGCCGRGGMWYPFTVQPQGTPVNGGTQITIQNLAYQPATLQVRVGTTVTWTNQDNVPHSVTFKNGMKDSGLLYQGQSFSYTFNTAGTYQYSCTVHPSMVATVTVT